MNPLKNPIAEQSRQWLIQSLLDLMSKKEYSEITVTEIAEHAHYPEGHFTVFSIQRKNCWSNTF